jgi:hypothetical protein
MRRAASVSHAGRECLQRGKSASRSYLRLASNDAPGNCDARAAAFRASPPNDVTVWLASGKPGSFMTGQTKWTVYGGLLAIAGIARLITANRRRV